MKVPHNSIPMIGAMGPHDYITMGGMFTIVKVRESLPNGYDKDPGWYKDKPGELASLAPPEVLRRNGIAADGSSAPKPPPGVNPAPPAATPTRGHAPDGDKPTQGGHGGHSNHGAAAGAATGAGGAAAGAGGAKAAPADAGRFTCPHHPEVVSAQPGKCPKCNMRLVQTK